MALAEKLKQKWKLRNVEIMPVKQWGVFDISFLGYILKELVL